MTDGVSPADRGAELLSKLAGLKPTPPDQSAPLWSAADIPDDPFEGSSGYVKNEVDIAVDGYVDRIDILDAYRRYINKMEPKVGRRRESIMISCPLPEHPDKDPSAWINLDKGTWFCGGCQVGGDKFDLAAIRFGYPRPEYKRNGDFPKMKREMAEDAGLVVVRSITGGEIVAGTEEVEEQAAFAEPNLPPVAEPVAEQPPQEIAAPALAVVPPVQLPASPEEMEWEAQNPFVDKVPFIDWQSIFPPNTFLRAWMDAVTVDDLPQEYYVFEGLQALSCIVGSNVQLIDFKPVKSNLYLCNYGATGTGKSRAIEPLMKILDEVAPYEADAYMGTTGCLHITTPGSAEALLDQFSFEILDMTTQAVLEYGQVNGILRIDELASYMARASRAGSSLKEMLIELFDVNGGDMRHYSRTGGRTVAHDPFANIITATQPKAIHAFLRRADTESGMLNRFIVVFGKPRVAPIAYGGVAQDLTVPAMMLKQIRLWADKPHEMVFANDALAEWSLFFYDKLAPIKSGEVDVESMFSRVDLHLKKIIILLTANEMLDHPTKEIVQRAVYLYDYLLATYKMFSGDISFSETTECQGRIMQVIENFAAANRPAPSMRDIVRHLGNRYPKEMIQKSMEVLVKLDLVAEDTTRPSGKGRATKRYRLATA